MKPTTIGFTLNYRDPVRTNRCIQSLLHDGVTHVLVWDNSSDEGKNTKALQETWNAETCVSIIQSPENLGFAAGVNRGIEHITSRFPEARLLLINNDAILLPGALTALNEALDRTQQAVLAYPTIDNDSHLLETFYYHRFFGLITFRALPGSFPYASGCCLLIDLSRAPMPVFNENFFMYGEDTYLGWTLGRERIIHVRDAMIRHEGSASSGIGSRFYESRLVAGHWLLARKLAKNRCDRILLYGGRLMTLPLRALLRAWRYRSGVPIRSLWEGWRIARGHDPQRQKAQRYLQLPEAATCSNNASHLGTMRSGE
ncbi:glycosyltransferase family 2 protein [Methylohalobius crimeensis]|uniref:glycosyltransferase family 2 protein n=1 Tax=Methylohalobius crimeensis TaxID=244365 RepID=UPI0003B4E92D|nr:glycosyltransferase family 2 protein [Methylohalobius crimeensis]